MHSHDQAYTVYTAYADTQLQKLHRPYANMVGMEW